MEQLAKALSAAQAEFGTVPQSGMNPFHKSKYSTIEDYVNAAKPILAKHGLSISQAPNLMDGQFVLTTILMHESGEHLASNQPIFCQPSKTRSLWAAQSPTLVATPMAQCWAWHLVTLMMTAMQPQRNPQSRRTLPRYSRLLSPLLPKLPHKRSGGQPISPSRSV